MKDYHQLIPRPAGPTLSQFDIDMFERRRRLKLPMEYRKFILEVNGGAPTASMFEHEGNSLYLQSFFYIDPKEEHGMDYEFSAFQMPPGWLPIALEGTGGRVILSTVDGSVLYIPSENLSPRNNEDSAIQIAESWAAFLDHCSGDDVAVENSETVWERIIRDSDIKGIQELIKNGFDIESRSPHGETLAQLAATCANTEMLEELLRCGASLRGTLHSAAIVGKIPMINWLCDHGADLSERNDAGQLPEEVALLKFVAKYIINKKQPPTSSQE